MKKIKVRLGKERSYNIIIGYKIIGLLGSLIEKLNLGNDAIVITNPAINSKYGDIILKGLRSRGFKASVLLIKGAETSKSSRVAVSVVERIVRLDRGKGLFIAAFGGGMTGDVAGFVASIYKRGIPYIQVPTTLLAQVDSSIGGKTAIDLPSAKNLIGAFYQPRIVVSDIKLIEKLPAPIFKSGLAEVIKYGIIKDKALFLFLERNIGRILRRDKECLEYIIYRSSMIKARIVQKDEYDKKGIRAFLNYGHTIGHAIEAAAAYSKLYSHGEAIAVGMIAAAEIAQKMGILKRRYAQRIINLVKEAGLPTRISKRINIDNIIKAQLYDKKIIHGVNRFVLPLCIGRAGIYENIPRKTIYEAIKNRYGG